MSKRKFVRCGPYKLYRVPDSSCYVGPGVDGDRIMLRWALGRERLPNPDGRAYGEWTAEISVPPTNNGEGVDLDGIMHWSGAGYERSAKVAAAKLWEFIEGVAGVYVDAYGWSEDGDGA